MELFPDKARTPIARDAPLAERMRPRTLDEFVGQDQLLGPGGPLEAVVSRKAPLPSLILWGPPGSGKTTLARLLAAHARFRFAAISAVMAGVKELRAEIADAERAHERGERTALFVDEIHRFNKAQQDALLPFVERGTVTFLGATTENPSFEVIPALRSRARVFGLKALGPEAVREVLRRALTDRDRGLGKLGLAISDEAEMLIVRFVNGDARRALGVLASAAERSDSEIGGEAVRASVAEPLPDYDKNGEAHYDVISAFIKSLRGSDPDAALYYLARMLDGGEAPRFITRRLLIFASEDIGNADPNALTLATSAAEAFDRVGLPEGRIILGQAVTYLACAPKSNASYRGINRAQEAVAEYGALPVPLKLRNAPTQLMKDEGYGDGYAYPHDHPEHFVTEQYLPDDLSDNPRRARFYQPSDQGDEAEIAARQQRRWGSKKDS